MHAQGKFLGLSVLKFADEIGELIKTHGVETVLDYGAGQGHQYLPPHSLDKKWGVKVTCYDPAVDGMDELSPGMFDMVICSDVLEHLAEEDITATLWRISERARRFAFLTVCCRPAKKTLPDGRNAHVTVKPLHWWEAKLKDVMQCPHCLRETP